MRITLFHSQGNIGSHIWWKSLWEMIIHDDLFVIWQETKQYFSSGLSFFHVSSIISLIIWTVWMRSFERRLHRPEFMWPLPDQLRLISDARSILLSSMSFHMDLPDSCGWMGGVLWTLGNMSLSRGFHGGERERERETRSASATGKCHRAALLPLS